MVASPVGCVERSGAYTHTHTHMRAHSRNRHFQVESASLSSSPCERSPVPRQDALRTAADEEPPVAQQRLELEEVLDTSDGNVRRAMARRRSSTSRSLQGDVPAIVCHRLAFKDGLFDHVHVGVGGSRIRSGSDAMQLYVDIRGVSGVVIANSRPVCIVLSCVVSSWLGFVSCGATRASGIDKPILRSGRSGFCLNSRSVFRWSGRVRRYASAVQR